MTELLLRFSQLIHKFLVEPDAVLFIDIQAIVWMPVLSGGIVDGK